MARTYVHWITCDCCGLTVEIPEGEVVQEGEGSLAGWGSEYSYGEYTCPDCDDRLSYAVAHAIKNETDKIARERGLVT